MGINWKNMEEPGLDTLEFFLFSILLVVKGISLVLPGKAGFEKKAYILNEKGQ